MSEKKLLTRKEAAEMLGLREQTLAVWSSTGRYNLKYIKSGRKVFYSIEHLHDFIIKNTYTKTI